MLRRTAVPLRRQANRSKLGSGETGAICVRKTARSIRQSNLRRKNVASRTAGKANNKKMREDSNANDAQTATA
jgi:hypothetical protein